MIGRTRPRVRPLLAAILLALALAIEAAVCPGLARADTSPPDAVFTKGVEALGRGEYGAAIDLFESLADQGFVSPDASYDRGLAYVMRVRAKADRPGDLGRAAAAFEETLLLRPGDHDADVALDLVRAEVVRRRARNSKDVVAARPTLDRVIVGLASEQTWGLAAFAASLLLAVGLVLRQRPRAPAAGAPAVPLHRPHGAAHVVGSVLAPTAFVALLVLVPLTWGARTLRLGTRPAVIVVPEAFVSDENGQQQRGEPIPEAASVEAGERRGGIVHVRWGATEGWVSTTAIRAIGP